MAYTYEIIEYVPDKRLTMRTSGPPFPMETTYTWEELTVLARLIDWRELLAVVRPETLLRWHRQGFRLF